MTVERVKLVGSRSRLNSSTRLSKQSVVSDPLSRKAYVVSCLFLPGPLTLTGMTLKQTLGQLLVEASLGAESLDTAKVLDSITEGWLDSVSVAAVLPTELWPRMTGC